MTVEGANPATAYLVAAFRRRSDHSSKGSLSEAPPLTSFDAEGAYDIFDPCPAFVVQFEFVQPRLMAQRMRDSLAESYMFHAVSLSNSHSPGSSSRTSLAITSKYPLLLRNTAKCRLFFTLPRSPGVSLPASIVSQSDCL